MLAARYTQRPKTAGEAHGPAVRAAPEWHRPPGAPRRLSLPARVGRRGAASASAPRPARGAGGVARGGGGCGAGWGGGGGSRGGGGSGVLGREGRRNRCVGDSNRRG